MAECYRTRQSRRNLRRIAPADGASRGSVDEAGAGRLFERRGQRAIFLAAGAGQGCDPVQVILRLVAVALFDLPQTVILPGLDVVRVGLQRALVPDLRRPCSRRACDRSSRSDWRRRRCRRGRAPSTARSRRHSRRGHRSWRRPRDNRLANAVSSMPGLTSLDFFFLLLTATAAAATAVGRGVNRGDDGRQTSATANSRQRQKPDRKSAHASLPISNGRSYTEAC